MVRRIILSLLLLLNATSLLAHAAPETEIDSVLGAMCDQISLHEPCTPEACALDSAKCPASDHLENPLSPQALEKAIRKGCGRRFRAICQSLPDGVQAYIAELNPMLSLRFLAPGLENKVVATGSLRLFLSSEHDQLIYSDGIAHIKDMDGDDLLEIGFDDNYANNYVTFARNNLLLKKGEHLDLLNQDGSQYARVCKNFRYDSAWCHPSKNIIIASKPYSHVDIWQPEDLSLHRWRNTARFPIKQNNFKDSIAFMPDRLIFFASAYETMTAFRQEDEHSRWNNYAEFEFLSNITSIRCHEQTDALLAVCDDGSLHLIQNCSQEPTQWIHQELLKEFDVCAASFFYDGNYTMRVATKDEQFFQLTKSLDTWLCCPLPIITKPMGETQSLDNVLFHRHENVVIAGYVGCYASRSDRIRFTPSKLFTFLTLEERLFVYLMVHGFKDDIPEAERTKLFNSLPDEAKTFVQVLESGE